MAVEVLDEKTVPVEHTETVKSSTDAEFLHMGKEATEFEQNISLRDAIRYYPWSILWSVMLSCSIIMEGYDIVLIGNLMAQPTFQKQYGGYYGEKLGYQISGPWQVGMGCATAIGTIVGAFANGWLTQRFGYRRTLLVSITAIAGFIFITFFSQNLPMLMAGQVLCGLPWGVFATMAPAYASEISPIKLRGYLANYVCLCWALGQLMAAGVLSGFSSNTTQWAYRLPFAVQWVWPIPLMIALWFAPESPYWLARKGRHEEAEKTLRRLTSKDFPFDHSKLLAMVIHTNRVEDESGIGSNYLDCFKGTNLRRTEIVCLVFVAQNTTGVAIGGTPTYFFVQAGVSADESFKFATGALGLASVGVLISWWLISRVGRRALYVWSSLALSVLLLLIGITATVSQNSQASFAQAGMVLAWEIIFYSTIGPVCYAIIGEIPAVSVRSKSICLARIAYYISQIFNMVVSPYMINPTEGNWKGKVGYFWAGTSFVTFLWAFFRLPETKDRSFAEIDYLFTTNTKTRQFSKTQVNTFDKVEERVKHVNKDVEQ
ncbi:sugar transporter [Aaosphaeria arxii CBS 175.79]|uniref:Sugar transporter n=1 Tax=Aaosphaeria arxii CBS 175.79 TaxID=1450172 RepID=A0A6A5XM40_9PLEO|nr:sugar transporter [Aaosphaeria arxii CBS 175.79]KAF2014212.1 sugar transporter [Aaosphaeria arxii CBS 175.79]